MSMFKYSLYEPLSLSGSFELSEAGSIVGGKLIIEPNQLPSLQLQVFHNQKGSLRPSINFNEYSKLPLIHAALEDNISCTIQNPILSQTGLSGGGVSIHGLSKHVVFSEYFTSETVFDGASVLFNLWPEFCHPQGWKNNAKYNKDPITIEIDSDKIIQFCESKTYSCIGEEAFYERIEFDNDINAQLIADIKVAVSKAKKDAGKDNITVNLKTDHRWDVRFKQQIGLKDLDNLENEIRHFANLIFVLTYFPATPISCDLLISKTLKKGGTYNAHYPWLYAASLSEKLLKRGEQFKHLFSPITFQKIESEWNLIVKNWFDLQPEIRPLLDVLLNNMEGGAIHFKFSRCADALKLIGQKKHYQWAVENFAFPALKEYLLEIFDVTSSEELGVCISEARAHIVHSEETKRNTWEKVSQVAHSIECFELIILSYLQKLIGVSDSLREAFQDYWLKKLKDIDWLKFQ